MGYPYPRSALVAGANSCRATLIATTGLCILGVELIRHLQNLTVERYRNIAGVRTVAERIIQIIAEYLPLGRAAGWCGFHGDRTALAVRQRCARASIVRDDKIGAARQWSGTERDRHRAVIRNPDRFRRPGSTRRCTMEGHRPGGD